MNRAVMFSFVFALATSAHAAPENLPTKLPAKLPAKKQSAKAERPAVKRSRIDFSERETSVIAVQKSVPAPKQETATVVKSRSIVAAPSGDASEPMSSFGTSKVATKSTDKTTVTTVTPAPAPEPVVVEQKIEQKIEQETVVTFPQPSIVPVEEYHRPAKVVGPELRREFEANEDVRLREVEVVKETSREDSKTVATTASNIETKPGFIQAIAPETISFLRAGYLNANYKKFDDRMNNSATSIGLGIARGFETTWGSFEARAAFDAYHAMDQSVTIDNIRMLSVRTEVAYWFSHSRVKPGVSLGLGWADYSIRSYRSVNGPNEQTVVLRTHAKSRAFSIIPASSLRVEVGHGLFVDTQTEFLALLGGDNGDAAQGLGLTVSLGWIF